MKKILKKVASRYMDSLSRVFSKHGTETDGKHPKHVKYDRALEKERSMIVNRLPGYFLIFSIIGTLYLLYQVIEPFFTTLLIAGVLTILFYGVYSKILKLFRGASRTASILTCVIVLCIIVVPLAFFIFLLAREGIDMYGTISEKISSGAFDFLFKWKEGGWFYDLKVRLAPVVDFDKLDIKAFVVDTARNVSTFLVAQSAEIAKNIGSIMLSSVIMLFSMFYLFKDGNKFIEKLTILSPLPKKYEVEILRRVKETIKAIAFGVFLTAIIQGLIAGIGYTIVGVSNPVFWATATAFFSLIPLVGTATIWVPIALITILTGNYVGGVFLGLWGVFVVGTIDNLVAPMLIGSRAKTYPLLTFFVVIGGIWVFGLQGLIFGPMVLILLLTLLHIYELEYKNVLDV